MNSIEQKVNKVRRRRYLVGFVIGGAVGLCSQLVEAEKLVVLEEAGGVPLIPLQVVEGVEGASVCAQLIKELMQDA